MKPTVEQINAQVEAFNEVPMNQHIVVAKQAFSMGDIEINPMEFKKFEAKTQGLMYVIAVAEDVNIGVKVGDSVRVQSYKPSPGVPPECIIPNHELVFVKQYDIITVEKK